MQSRFIARRTPRVRTLLLVTMLVLTGLIAAAPRVIAQQAEPAQAPVAGRITYVPIALDSANVPSDASVWIIPSAASVAPNSFFALKVYAKNNGTTDVPFANVLVAWNTNLASFESSEADAGDFVATQSNGVQAQFGTPIAPGQERVITLVLRARTGINNVDVQFGGDFSASNNQSGYLNYVNVWIGSNPPPPSVRFACLFGRGGAGPLGQNPAAGNNPFGTTYTFGAFRKQNGGCGFTFSPNARVSYWVAQPTGPSVPLNVYGNANASGEVQLTYNTTPLLNVCPVNLCAFAMNAASNTNYVLVAPFNLSRTGSSAGQDELPAGVAAQPSRAADTAGTVAPAQVSEDGPEYGALGGLTGVVTGAGGGPLEGVLVALYDPAAGDFVDWDQTAADGSYLFPAGLASGDYEVYFSAAQGSNDALSDYADSVLPVTIAEPDIATLNATLSLGGQISGTVTGEGTGAPLDDVLVLVYDETKENLVGLTSTDENGTYTTDALPSGNYVVEFDPTLSSDDAATAYVGEYSSNQPLATAAPTTVTVTAPAPLPGVDAQLARCATCGQISGKVTAAEGGAPLGDVTVVIRNAADGTQVDVETTDADGSYASLLPTGSYTVEFFTDLSPNDTVRAYSDGFVGGATPASISVTAPNITANVNGVLSRAGQFSGQVVGDNSQGLDEVFILISDASGKLVTTAFTDATGSYTSPALAPGSYTLTFTTANSASEATRAYKQGTLKATLPGPGSRSTTNIKLGR